MLRYYGEVKIYVQLVGKEKKNHLKLTEESSKQLNNLSIFNRIGTWPTASRTTATSGTMEPSPRPGRIPTILVREPDQCDIRKLFIFKYFRTWFRFRRDNYLLKYLRCVILY